MEPSGKASGLAEVALDVPATGREDRRGWPNAETIEALEEAERIMRDPALRRGCTSVEAMFAEILADDAIDD